MASCNKYTFVLVYFQSSGSIVEKLFFLVFQSVVNLCLLKHSVTLGNKQKSLNSNHIGNSLDQVFFYQANLPICLQFPTWPA